MTSHSHSDAGRLRLRARLRRAGWVEDQGRENPVRGEIDWTVAGLQRAILLRDVIDSHGLDQTDVSLAQFTREALKIGGHGIKQKGRVAARFWAYCVAELGMRHDLDEEGLRHLVDLVLQASEPIEPTD